MRLSGTQARSISSSRGLGNQLWDLAGNRPSLDLRFADNKSLVDATTGTTLVDHTRAGRATYVGSDGLIKTATTNLLLQSEDFLTTWSKSAGVSVTLDSSQGEPFSGAVVSRIDFTAGSQVLNQTRTYISGTHTASIWIKGVASETIQFAGETGTSVEVVTLTGEWQRLSQTFTAVASTQNFSINTFNSVTARTIYITAAQLEQSDTVGEYVKTTSTINSAPRFDHDPTTGESLGLLVEESRTNLLLMSEEFDDASYWARMGAGLTVNAINSPTGVQSADFLVPGLAVSEQRLRRDVSGISSNTAYTLSVFAKAGGYNYIAIDHGDYFVADYYTYFDLQNGVVATNAAGNTPQITDLGNGWYRCSVTRTTTATQTTISARYAAVQSDNVLSFAGDGTSGIYLWGAQLEAGSFPTSYIPTTSSTVTRAADVASISGSNFSSWYRQDEGTFFADIIGFPITSGQFPRIFEASDGTSNNIIRSQQYGANTVRNNISAGGSFTMAQDGGMIAARISGKTAFGVAENNCAITTNGGTPSVDNTVTLPSNLNQLGILGTTGRTSIANSTISRFTYWPQRLPNETLQGITQ